MSKKYFIIAGESSGDLHGSNLMHAMCQIDSKITFEGIGGNLMISQGLSSMYDLNKMAVMGFVEVLKNYRFFKSVQKNVLNNIVEGNYSGVILIDYPGFNLRIAKQLKSVLPNIPIYYYISPQIWAWKENRIQYIKKYIDKMIVIFEFEKDWYTERGIDALFVGHPFLDIYKDINRKSCREKLNLKGDDKCLTLFPGSREQEINNHLPAMLSALENDFFSDFKVFIGLAPDVDKAILSNYNLNNVVIVNEKSENALMAADCAWIGSGTNTLQAALFDIPFILVYKTSSISWFVMKNFVKVEYAGMPNIIYGDKLIPELLQNNLTDTNLINETNRFFNDLEYKQSILKGYKVIRKKLGTEGASSRTANIILEEK